MDPEPWTPLQWQKTPLQLALPGRRLEPGKSSASSDFTPTPRRPNETSVSTKSPTIRRAGRARGGGHPGSGGSSRLRPRPGAHLHHAAAQGILLSVGNDDSTGREARVQEVNHGDPRRGVRRVPPSSRDPDPARGGVDPRREAAEQRRIREQSTQRPCR